MYWGLLAGAVGAGDSGEKLRRGLWKGLLGGHVGAF